MSGILTTTKALDAIMPLLAGFSTTGIDDAIATAQYHVDTEPENQWWAGHLAGLQQGREHMLVFAPPDSEAVQAALEAGVLPQKVARGAEGGKVSKAEANRVVKQKVERAADKQRAATSDRWIDQKLREAHDRAKKFGASGLKTGKLTTGSLTPTQLVHRIKKNFRRRKR